MQNRIDDYKRGLDTIEAGEEFKRDTKAMLLATLAQEAPPEKAAAEAPEETKKREPEAKPGPEPKKNTTVRFPHWMKPAMAVAAVALVAVVAVRAVNTGNRGTTAEMAMMAEDAPAAAADEAWDDGAVWEEQAEMDTAESYMMATGEAETEGYFTPTESMTRRAVPESFTIGGMESFTGGHQAILLYGFGEYGGLLLGEGDVPGTLPVFRNTAQRNTADARLEGRENELEAIGYDIATALGADVEKVSHYEQDILSYIEFQCAGGVTINVFADEGVHIWFTEARQIVPHAVTAEDNAAAWEDLAYETIAGYREVFAGMQSPAAEALFERGFDGDASWYLTVYDGAGGLADQTQSRSLRGARLAYDETGRLMGFTLYRHDRELLGWYDTISLAEATEALAAGSYVTTVPGSFPGVEYIAGADLVYLATGYEESFLPFYMFYVEDTGQDMSGYVEGLVSYGVWYVPAISGEHVNSLEGQPFFN